jgi:hypothetical protein
MTDAGSPVREARVTAAHQHAPGPLDGARAEWSTAVSGIRLSQRQVAQLIRLLCSVRPPPVLLRALMARSQGDPGRVIGVVQEALADDGPLISALSSVLAQSAGGEALERAVFRREGDYWTIRYRGSLAHLRHTSGLVCLARLLERPGLRLHSLDLLGDSPRRSLQDIERARVSVTKAIGAALSRIDRALPQLGQHLRATVHRGYRCSYTPDPRHVPAWNT